MTTAAIAKVLTDELGNVELSRAGKRLIIPKHHESIWTDEALDSAFEDAKRLSRQCSELKELLPNNAELYDSQLADGVRKAAETIQQALEQTP